MPQLNFSVDDELKDSLDKLARDNLVSLAQYLRIVLRDHVAQGGGRIRVTPEGGEP